MKSRKNIVIAYSLAALFTVFNVGLPIVFFVCPMMSGGQVCDCKKVHDDGLAISYPIGECCQHSILADRNTVPFLSSTKYQAPGPEVVLALSSTSLPAMNLAHPAQFDYSLNTGPPPSAAPIYLLSSSFLI